MPLSIQLDNFKHYIREIKSNNGEEVAHNIITNSVVLVVAITNDLLLSLLIRTLQYDVTAYVNMLVKSALDFVQVLILFRFSMISNCIIIYIFRLSFAR